MSPLLSGVVLVATVQIMRGVMVESGGNGS